MNNYEIVIGLEVHVELATKSKIFCGCKNSFGEKPNINICPVCVGMPGTLPVLNKKVVEHAMAVGLACNCEISKVCMFDRKNYFYPDNPQNYQISQLYYPICQNGYVEIETKNGKKRIRIHEIHMEEDAGKLIHDDNDTTSLVDYNRAGVPLIEIVSKADMSDSEEVIAYLDKLRTTIQYLGASDCKLNEGSMRVDVNLSVREKGDAEYGTRTEMKNLNSFRSISNAIENESLRQIDLLEKGEKVVMETRRWDEHTNCSYSMRSKEDSRDYRYFPEPDLPKLYIDDEWIERIRKGLPEFREAKMERYKEQYDLPQHDINILTERKRLTDLFEQTVLIYDKPKKVSNWLMGETMRLVRERKIDADDISFSPQNFAKLLKMVDNKQLSNQVAKEIFEKIFDEDIDPQIYVKENGIENISDEEQLRQIILEVVNENPQSVTDYKNGKNKAMGFLVGQTMKKTKGKANPTMINEILFEMLN